ncbi:YveK family protein [Neobacillus sp. Marseille-QA0830]
MHRTIGILDLLKILLKHWRLITLLTLVAVLLSGVVTFYLITPKFQASTQILVNQKNNENQIDYSSLDKNIELINTYSVIIKSPVILEKVIEELNLKQNLEQLENNLTITNKENSQVFTLTVQDTSMANAVEIANTISETFQQEIKGIMNVDNVSILAEAKIKENTKPVSPNLLLNIAVSFVIGLLVGMGISFLLEFMDNSIKNEEDAAAYLGVPVLGTIQKIPRVHKNKGKELSEIKKAGSESVVS